jgi:hypothetical protein
MMPVKRVEILTGIQEFDSVVEILEGLGITGYMVLRNVQAGGDRRLGSVDPLTGASQHRLIKTTCSPQKIGELVEAIRPVVSRYGGACIVYDAECVIHASPGVVGAARAAGTRPTL